MFPPFLWRTMQYRCAGVTPNSSCANKQDGVSIECDELKICVNENTIWFPITHSLFHESYIVVADYFEDAILFMNSGVCNVIAVEHTFVMEASVRAGGSQVLNMR